MRYGRLEELLKSTGEMTIALRNFMPDAEFRAQWGEAIAPGTWKTPASDVRRFLETAWTRGAELVSVTPMHGDLSSLFLEWTSSEATTR